MDGIYVGRQVLSTWNTADLICSQLNADTSYIGKNIPVQHGTRIVLELSHATFCHHLATISPL